MKPAPTRRHLMPDGHIWVPAEAEDIQHGRVLTLQDRLREAEEERNTWIKRWNRLDAAVSKHRTKAPEWIDERDEELHAAHDRILKDTTTKEAE